MKKYEHLSLRGRIWHYEFIRNGKRFRGSTNTHIVKQAQAIVRQKIEEAEGGQTPVTERARAVATLDEMEAWDLRRAKRTGDPKVVDSSLTFSWKRLRHFFDAPEAVSADAIENYADWALSRHMSSATIRRDVYAIRRAYDWAQELYPQLPHLKRRKLTLKTTPKADTAGEVVPDEFLQAIFYDLRPAPAAKLLISLCTGIRHEELKRAQRTWVRDEGNGLYVLRLPKEATKTNQHRDLPMTEDLGRVARGYLPFKVDYRSAWNTAARHVGLKTLHGRDLRHTFATRMGPFDQHGVDLVMGHVTDTHHAGHHYQHPEATRLKAIAREVTRRFTWIGAAITHAIGAMR